MAKTDREKALRTRRHARVRRKVAGTPERPRLAVNRSLRHITVQVIDDSSGRTLAAASTADRELRDALSGKGGGNVSAAQAVGRLVAARAKSAGVAKVVFDRGGFKYHGRVAALADAARSEGLEF
ncbi:MAG TPA: 50S ribosomal protein L18 [Acidimicrobiales bacterium]|nr:50S ribosomal protein L18 [Acidimicrobiales bacterium]